MQYGDDDLREVIDLHIGGQPVMLSRRKTYYLLHVVDDGFSSYFCREAWDRDIRLHTRLNGSHRADDLIHSLHQLGIYRGNYLNRMKLFLEATPHWVSS